MKKIPDYLILNGKIITRKNLHEVEERSIQNFLNDWWNDSIDFILQKTSGSTGIPKEIKLSKEKMINSAIATLTFFQLKKEQKMLLCLPVDFIAGKMMLIRAMIGELSIDYWGHDTHILKNINLKNEYDFCAMIPLQVHHAIVEEKEKYEKIKTVLVGGAAIPHAIRQQILICKNKAYASFGMTETITHIALQEISHQNSDQIYQALPGVQLGQDKNSCLTIHAPEICNDDICSNDVVEFTDFNQFKWLGRIDHVINSGGLKIHPEEIEKKISELITDRNFFVFGIDHEELGKELVLFIEGKKFDDVTEKLFIDHLRESLPRNKAPKKLYYCDQFVYSSNRKLLRRESASYCLSKN